MEKNIEQLTFDFENNEDIKFDFSQSVGDPFVEIGRLGLIEFCGKSKFDSFEELRKCVEKLFNIYVFKTSGRIGQIFSSNSKFTHNSTGKNLKERLRQSLEFFDELCKESNDGYCISCGKESNLSNVSKTLFPLTTGGKNVNFTSNFSDKFLMCKSCMSSLFFTPINMQKVAGKMAFLISSNEEINEFWSENNIEEFNFNIAKMTDSLIDSKINIFENFIYKIIEELQEENLFGNITFYLISNVDKDSNIEVIHIYENQLKFISQVAPNFLKNNLPTKAKDEWNYLIFKYSSKDSRDKYRTRKEKINGKDKTIKFEDEVIQNGNYKESIKYFNPLIENFVNGKSILYFFKLNRCSWNLTEIYLKEIKHMREEKLSVIKSIADKLQNFNSDDNEFYKKYIFKIEQTKSFDDFREVLRTFMKKYKEISDENLFTVDEMVFQILPKDASWRETKDILLIALYEKLNLKDEEIEDLEGEENED